MAPFFEVFTLPAGTASREITFTAPDKLSTYVVRVFAATASSPTVSSAVANVTVRAPEVSLTPSSPRVLRVGDRSSAGVIVTNTGNTTASQDVTVRVSLGASTIANGTLSSLDDAAGGLGSSAGVSKTITLVGAMSSEVRFGYIAESVGPTTLEFVAEVAGAQGPADAVAVEMQTLPPQEEVFRGATNIVAAGVPAQQGLALPDALPGAVSLAHCVCEHNASCVARERLSLWWRSAALGGGRLGAYPLPVDATRHSFIWYAGRCAPDVMLVVLSWR